MLLDKLDYLNKAEDVLNDKSKFVKVNDVLNSLIIKKILTFQGNLNSTLIYWAYKISKNIRFPLKNIFNYILKKNGFSKITF